MIGGPRAVDYELNDPSSSAGVLKNHKLVQCGTTDASAFNEVGK